MCCWKSKQCLNTYINFVIKESNYFNLITCSFRNDFSFVGNAVDRSRVSDRLSTSRLIELVKLIKIDDSFRVCPNMTRMVIVHNPIWTDAKRIINNYSCHVFPFMANHIEMFPLGLRDFCGLYCGTGVVDFSAEVTCFPILHRANFATD